MDLSSVIVISAGIFFSGAAAVIGGSYIAFKSRKRK
jgi:hypothetical protein